MKDVNHFSDTLYYTVRAAIRENGGFFCPNVKNLGL